MPLTAAPTVSVDVPVALARERWPSRPLKVLLPRKPTDPYELTALGETGPISVGVLGMDRYSGAVLADNPDERLPWHQRARQWALPVHQGSVYGLTSKVVAVVACLGLAGLAVSGVWMWLVRRGRFPRAADGPVPLPAVVLILAFAVALPAVGASLLAVLAGEWLAGRLTPGGRGVARPTHRDSTPERLPL